jgi:hypothetical protein
MYSSSPAFAMRFPACASSVHGVCGVNYCDDDDVTTHSLLITLVNLPGKSFVGPQCFSPTLVHRVINRDSCHEHDVFSATNIHWDGLINTWFASSQTLDPYGPGLSGPQCVLSHPSLAQLRVQFNTMNDRQTRGLHCLDGRVRDNSKKVMACDEEAER